MSAEEITSGLMLGRYELLVPIAKGGTASVWAARMKGPRGFEKIVAVKVMLSEFGEDPDAETMFLDEARLVSRIRNLNVAEVLDLGEEADALFIVMEWVDGEPLHVIAREARGAGGVPLPIVGQIAKQVCSGLHAAHDLRDTSGKTVGLVHRDVSPQNILVGYDGIVKVIDFGVAKAASNQLRTSVGQIKGKVAYMAPEQAFGEPVDRRTDIFALGIVLYHLLTGKHPFRGDNEFATLGRIRDKRPVDSPRTLVPALPEAIQRVIMKALSKNRNDRYADMMELSRALEEAFPPLDESSEALAAFMAKLLGSRGEKKRIAIREALQRADENQPPPSTVPAAFDTAKTMDPDDGRALAASLGAIRGSIPSVPGSGPTSQPRGEVVAGLASASLWDAEVEVPIVIEASGWPPAPVARSPSFPSNPGIAAALPAAPVQGGLSYQPDESLSAVPDFRPKRLGIKVVAAAMAIALAVGLAIWGASDDSPGHPETSSGSPVGKKPW